MIFTKQKEDNEKLSPERKKTREYTHTHLKKKVNKHKHGITTKRHFYFQRQNFKFLPHFTKQLISNFQILQLC